MKKKLVSILLFALMSVITISSLNVYAGIGDFYYDEDTGFFDFLDEIEEEYGYVYDDIDWQKENLYNLSGGISGVLFEFTLDGITDGFMLMAVFKDVNGITVYETTEIFFETKSPFYGAVGTKIYPTFSAYILKIDDTYFDLALQQEVSLEAVQGLEEQGFGFKGDQIWWDATHSIYYHHKSDTWEGIAIKAPAYTSGTALGPNACAVTAGAVIVGYWDKFKTSLIPNWTPGYYFLSKYYWKVEETPPREAADDLYVYMGTNQNGDGTTITGFKTGIIDYADDHGGYDVTYRTVMSGGIYSLSLMNTEFNNGRPVALFLSPYYNLTSDIGIVAYSGYDTIYLTIYQSSHVMVTYGLRTILYYNSSGQLIKTDRYLAVSSGVGGCGKGYLRLTDTLCNIYDAFSVEIS